MGKHRDWTEIRQEYEKGASFSKLSSKHQIAMGTLKKAAAREGWQHKEKATRAAREEKALQKIKREPMKSRPENGTTPVPFPEDVECPEQTQITQDMVLREVAAIAFADVNDIVTIRDGAVFLRNTDDLTPVQRKIIAGIKEGRSGIEVKFYDRLRALELLGRHLGLFEQKKDELDREEQRARIDKLRAETRTDDAASRTVTVRFVDIYGDDDNA